MVLFCPEKTKHKGRVNLKGGGWGGVISDAYKTELKVLTSTEPTSDAHIKP